MRVFLTGAAGFIGRAVLAALLRDGHTVTALLMFHEDALAVPGAAVVRGDVTSPETLEGKLTGHDAVVHVAGCVGFQPRRDCDRVNVGGAHNIVQAAVEAGVRRFVHMSSVSVYGRTPGKLLHEDVLMVRIGDPYGDTKIAAEEIVREAEARGQLDLTVLRPTAVYGENDGRFLPQLLQNLMSGNFRLIGTGEQRVDLVHVRDVATLVAVVLRCPASVGRTYNVARAGNPSWREFAAFVCSEVGVAPVEKHIPFALAYYLAAVMEVGCWLTGKPPRLSRYSVRLVGRDYAYDCSRAQCELDFEAQIPLREGFRDCLRREGPDVLERLRRQNELRSRGLATVALLLLLLCLCAFVLVFGF